MRDLLYLTHRIPYPPNKGDKIRAFHVLRYLSQHYRVHLGSFIDDASDLAHAATLRRWCYNQHLVRIHPLQQRLLSSRALVQHLPLSVLYYRHRSLLNWVHQVCNSYPIAQVVAFSGAMAQYFPPSRAHGSLRCVLDLVDVDSEKWLQYAADVARPLSWLYGREARVLRAYELAMAREADHVMLVSPAEAQLFRTCGPELGDKVDYFSNGVDSDYFAPDASLPSPYGTGPNLVFTGAMDYRPNIEAAIWLAEQILPPLLRQFPHLRLHLVGARPAARVRRLSRQRGVHVSGTVPDIRPYLQHATLVLAPLRIARGIQNKVLEAMSMARTVIATPAAMVGIAYTPGQEVLLAETTDAFTAAIAEQLVHPTPLGAQARQRVLRDYQWELNLARLGNALGLTGELA